MTNDSNREEGEARTPAGVRWLALVAGLVIALLGGKSVIQDAKYIHKLTHLDSLYEITPARFLKVEIRRDSAGSENEWYPDVLYEYFIEKKSVWGWRFSFEDEPRPKVFWEERLRNYHAGNWVNVFVNPADPKDSFVEKERDSLARPIMKALLGIGFALTGLLLSGLTIWGWFRNLVRRA